jgi:hypothetical protein
VQAVGESLLVVFKKLGFEVGDAFVGEAEVGAGAFESFLQGSVFLRQLLDTTFEGGVLRGDPLDGLAGDYLLEVPELSHQLPDPLPLGEDLVLRPGQLILGVECSLSP